MANQKLKSHRGAKKRFKVTKNGKVKYARANKTHILTKKSAKRKRQLRHTKVADKSDMKRIKKMLPYN